MSWRRNELITVSLPKPRVARTVCYVNCFVQPTANTKTCLPKNNHGEYRKSPFNLFSAQANRRNCLKKRKSLRRIPKRAIYIFPTRRIGQSAFFSSRLRLIRHRDAHHFFLPMANLIQRCQHFLVAYGEKKGRNKKKRPAAKKCWAPKIACCAKGNQPCGDCFVKRLFLSKCCASATVQQLIKALDTV